MIAAPARIYTPYTLDTFTKPALIAPFGVRAARPIVYANGNQRECGARLFAFLCIQGSRSLSLSLSLSLCVQVVPLKTYYMRPFTLSQQLALCISRYRNLYFFSCCFYFSPFRCLLLAFILP